MLLLEEIRIKKTNTNVINFDILFWVPRKSEIIVIVRASFGLDPKIGLSFGPTNLNNKFVEHGRKN